ncbi:MAG: L,D-transpeptidase [Actinobacteria bacterium]|nr:L,D-transpeptidase [Actinomycetota bacterium]
MTAAMKRDHSHRPKLAPAVLALTLLVAGLIAGVTSRAEAGPNRAPQIDVIGSGPLVWKQVVVRSRPTPASPRVAVLSQFRGNYRPQYVLALAQRLDAEGLPSWYRVSVPGRPNGRKGWVRAEAVDIKPVEKRLIVYRGTRKFEFWDGKRLVRAGKVAVGKSGAETPLGLFYVTWKFNPRIDPEWAILGAYAFETSAYSRLTDWPGGGIVGVHGTPWPELLGQAVSHGCVRLANENITFLRSRVPLGTPVQIVR